MNDSEVHNLNIQSLESCFVIRQEVKTIKISGEIIPWDGATCELNLQGSMPTMKDGE